MMQETTVKKGNPVRTVGVLLLALLLYAAWSAAVVVDETQLAIVTRFGSPIREIKTAGLSFKWPAPIDRVEIMDRRLLVLDVPASGEQPREFLTLDKKHIEVSAYAAWRITQPRRFLETAGDRKRAESLLADVLLAEMGKTLGRNNLTALLSTKSDEFKLDEIIATIREACRGPVESYGAELVDFRIKRVNFPEQNRASVFERMRQERKTIATKIRAEGAERASKIRSDADRQRREIQSRAYQEAQETEGKAEAEASRIYADAFGKDPDFYEFIRTLESYEKTLTRGTTLVLGANSKYLKTLFSDWTKTTPSDESAPRSHPKDTP